MTMLEKVAVSVCSSRLINDKGRRILITGITHLVVARALSIDANFKQLNEETQVTRNPHAFIACGWLTGSLKRKLCLESEQLRSIPVERLAGWFLHYTPKWLRYQDCKYCIRSDIEQAITVTLSRA